MAARYGACRFRAAVICRKLLTVARRKGKKRTAKQAKQDTAAQLKASTSRGTATKSKRPRKRAVGGTGTRITSGFIQDMESNPSLRGSLWYGKPGQLGIVDKMLTDPHVKKSLEYISDPLTAADWYMEPFSESALDKEIAAFCEFAFFKCIGWDKILKRQIRNYAARGFSLEEMTDDATELPPGKFPAHPGGGFGIVPTSLQHRPAWTIDGFEQSKRRTDQVHSIRQYIIGSDGEVSGFRKILANRLIRMSYDQEGSQFEGNAVLRGAYQPWKLKIAFLTMQAIGFERTAVGTPTLIASEDATDEDLDAAETILAEMRVNEKSWVVFPNGYTFKWGGAGESDAENLLLAIEMCDKDIAYNVTAGFMMLSLMGKTGSNAIGATQQVPYHVYVGSHAKFIANAYNIGQDGWSPIERIVRLNYGTGVGVPELRAKNLPTRDWVAISGAIYQGINVGAITADGPLEAELRQGFRLGPHDPATARARPFSAAEGTGKTEQPMEAPQ